MKVGVIARATDRGLGVQTYEAARNLDASVLVVDVRNASGIRFPTDPNRFPGAPIVECLPGWKLDEQVVRQWLDGLDVVYSAETFYDDNLPDWARSMGVATVVHANPEFVPRDGGWAIGEPTARWSPTCWRNRLMPQPTQVVPFPVATDRFSVVEPHGKPCRWLHIAGKQAMADRNGTDALVAALKLLRKPCSVTIATQEPDLPRIPELDHVDVKVVGPAEQYWQHYADHDALVMPRRYGGLCLPVQEAMASGMAVVMPNIEPNPQTWPIAPVPAVFDTEAHMPGGLIPIASVNPGQLAAAMDRLSDPWIRHGLQRRSRDWARRNSWTAARPEWLARFNAMR